MNRIKEALSRVWNVIGAVPPIVLSLLKVCLPCMPSGLPLRVGLILGAILSAAAALLAPTIRDQRKATWILSATGVLFFALHTWMMYGSERPAVSIEWDIGQGVAFSLMLAAFAGFLGIVIDRVAKRIKTDAAES